MYSIRVDPEHDTPDVLRSYAQGYGVKRGWWFLTGTKADLERLRVGFGDDPSLERSRSNHLNLIRFGIEPLERWAVCPAWMTPKAILEFLSWIEPKGRRPGAQPPLIAQDRAGSQ